MGLFTKKKKVNPILANQKVNSMGDDLTKLNSDGELPFGWVAHHMEFTQKIKDEYGYFLDTWVESRNNGILKHYEALKSFILYIQDAKKLCVSKGECFEKWFNDCVADNNYLDERKKELSDIESNIDELLKKEKERKVLEETVLPTLSEDVVQVILNNPGILQKDVYKQFPEGVKQDISSVLYFMEKEGKIVREKEGNTYKLYVK